MVIFPSMKVPGIVMCLLIKMVRFNPSGLNRVTTNKERMLGVCSGVGGVSGGYVQGKGVG